MITIPKEAREIKGNKNHRKNKGGNQKRAFAGICFTNTPGGKRCRRRVQKKFCEKSFKSRERKNHLRL